MISAAKISFHHSFNIITGMGLGVSYSSLSQLGHSLWPYHPAGQAKIECAVNCYTKNIYLKDRSFRFEEGNGILELFYRYNSQAANQSNAWQLSIRKLTNMGSNSITVIEEDGHETSYNTLSGSNIFQPSAFGNGTPNLVKNGSFWELYNPTTETIEFFDEKGFLNKKTDRYGQTTFFEYKSGELSAIMSSSGDQYLIERTGQQGAGYTSTISLQKAGEQSKILLHTYNFDGNGRLVQSITPKGYKTTYTYWNTNRQDIYKIEQSDGSQFTFNYPNNDEMIVISGLGGQTSFDKRYTLSKKKNDPKILDILDNLNLHHNIVIDDHGRLQQYTYPHGFNESSDSLKVDYYDEGQIKVITYPNGKTDQFEYMPVLGLKIKETLSDGYLNQFYYRDSKDIRPPLITKMTNGTNQTNYIHQPDPNDSNKLKLRFEISPQGRVKEYCYEGSFVKEIREYPDTFYTDRYKPQDDYSTGTLEAWTEKRDFTKIKLTGLNHNTRGQLREKNTYVAVTKKDGKIVPVETNMSQEKFFPDIYGNVLIHETKQDTNKIQTQTSEFNDDFKRQTSFKVSDQNTFWNYDDFKRIVSKQYPNNRIEIINYNVYGNPITVSITAKDAKGTDETRIVEYSLNRTYLKLTEKFSNSSYTIESYKIYDYEGNLAFEINASGAVIEHNYNHQKDCKTTIRYVNKISMQEFKTNPSLLMLKKLLKKDPNEDHYAFILFDPKGGPQFTIDEDGYIVENILDKEKRDAGKVSYLKKYNDSEIKQFISNRTEIKINSNEDRFTQKFYDNDGKLRGEVDAAGYLTEYICDAANFITQKNIYFVPVTDRGRNSTFEEIKSKSGLKISSTYYFGNGKNEVELEVDQYGYITKHDYYNNSLKKSSTRYATQSSFDPKTKQRPNLPDETKEDETIAYQYDILNREVEVKYSNGKREYYEYDVMDQMILSEVSDTFKNSTHPDYFRQTRNQFNGFGEVIKKANPYITQEMINEPSREKEIWDNESHRLIYAQGLNVKSIDSLNRTTVYYYDQEKRPYVAIDPMGVITYITYDVFSNKREIRRYKKAIPSDVLPTLSGGFNTDEIKTYIEQKDDQLDLVDVFDYTKCGLLKQHIDPKKNVYTFEPNAFRQIEKEFIPIVDAKPMEVTHQFDTRGNEKSTTKKTNDLETTTCQEFNSPHNKKTADIDELGNKTSYAIDLLGRMYEITNALNKKSQIEYNAFRPFKFIDELSRIKELIYTQQNRTVVTQLYQQPGDDKLPGPKTVLSTETKNVFDQSVISQNGLGQTVRTEHEPDGQVHIETNPLNQYACNQHDSEGQLWFSVNTTGLKTTLTRNAAGNVTEQKEQKVGTALQSRLDKQYVFIEHNEVKQQVLETKAKENPCYTTSFVPDTFGRVEKKTDPLSVTTQNVFDKCDNQTESKITITQDKADIATGTSYNSANQPLTLSVEQKDEKEAKLKDLKQTNKRTDRDSMGRETGQTIDPGPGGLNNSTSQTLNKKGLFTSKTDEENNTTFYIRDALDQIRFIVDARRGVVEKIYDDNGQLIKTISYTNRLNPEFKISVDTKPDEVKSNVATDQSDTGSLYFYGLQKNQERFRLDLIKDAKGQPKAILHETNYDDAFRPISNIDYFKQVNADNLALFTTSYLENLDKETPGKDRAEHRILDALGRNRFVIDSKGYVTEFVYDNNGNITISTVYANPLTREQIKEIIQLSESEIQNRLPKDADRDITEYNIYDDLKHLIFTVDGKCGVIGYDKTYYDDMLSECHYDKKVTGFFNYDQLCVKLKSEYKPDPKVDRLSTIRYDEARRKRQTTNPLGKQKNLTPDVLGNISNEIDEAEKLWVSVFDKASRLIETRTPMISIPTPKQPIVTAKEYYKTGKIRTITEAKGLPKERTTAYEYDELGNLILAKVLDSGQEFKCKLKDVSGYTIYQASYNAKNIKISEQNKAGEWTYYVHDEQNRILFSVNSVGVITEHVRDTFGDEVNTKQYNKSIAIQDEYVTKGIPLKEIMSVITDAKYNQSNQLYDTRGDLIRKEVLNGDKVIATDVMEYNALRKSVCSKKLIKDNDYSSKFTFYDKTSKTIAEIDEQKFVKGMERNIHSEITKETNFTNALTVEPDANWSEAQLAEYLAGITNEKDRIKETTYTLCGQVQDEIDVGLVTQEPVEIKTSPKETKSQPVLNNSSPNEIKGSSASVAPKTRALAFKNKEPQDAKTSYQYDDVQNKVKTTLPNNAELYHYYDERHALVAETGIPRDVIEEHDVIFTNTLPTSESIKSIKSHSIYIRYLDKLFYANKVAQEIKEIKIEIAQLKEFDEKIKPSTTLKRLIPADLKDINTITNHSVNEKTKRTPFFKYNVDALKQVQETTEFKLGACSDPVIGKLPEYKDTPNDFVTQTVRDKQGYIKKQVIDSNNLNITTERNPNQKDLPLWETDPKGNKWRLYYDDQNRQRFKIGPQGEVYEQEWDTFDNINVKRVYEQKIDLSKITDKTSLAEIITLATQIKSKNNSDSVTYQVFDQNKNLRFAIKLVGKPVPVQKTDAKEVKDVPYQVSVIGYQYNGLNKTTSSTEYNTLLNEQDIINKDANELEELMSKKKDPEDRTIFYIRNARGEPCIIIAPNGGVTEQEFDADGNMIRQTKYSNRVLNPEDFSKNSLMQAKNLLKGDPEHDRTIYNVYNYKLKKLEYTIDAMCGVTRYAYNISKQCLGKTLYDQKIETPKDYNDLLTKLQALKPNPELDQTFVNTLDDAGQILEEISPIPSYIDAYQYDLFSNRVIQTNKKGSQFVFGFDTAKRQTTMTTPGILATQVNFDGAHLNCNQLENQRSIEEKILDNLGFTVQLTKAKGSYEERKINSSYNYDGQLTDTEIKDVNVDNDGIASFNNRPEKKVNIKTQKIYNTKKQLVSECDENNIWKFYVYDTCNKEPIYEINNAGAVVQYQRNAFGQSELITHYDAKLTISLESYKTTGIPRNVVEDNLKHNSAKDRWVKLTYNQLGKVSNEEYNPVYCLNPEDAKKLAVRLPTDDKKEVKVSDVISLNKISPKTTYDYNTFGDQISAKKQLDAKTIAETNRYFNRNGKKIAELSPKMFLTRLFYDVFGNETKSYLTDQALENRIKLNATQAEIDAIADKKASENDQVIEKGYNRLNLIDTKVFTNVPVAISKFEEGKPLTYEEKIITLTLSFTYTPTGKIESIKDEKNGMQFYYYNATDDLIAFTDVPRLLDYDTKLIGIPITQNGVNLHGQIVAVKNSKNSAISSFYNILQGVVPNGKLQNNFDDPSDQITLTQVDNRGKVSIKQDPAGNITGSTQTPSGEIARTWSLQTGHEIKKENDLKGELKALFRDKEGNVVVRATHTEEERVIWDVATGLPCGKAILRDHQELQRTEALLNTFLEVEQEGPGNGVWMAQTIRDNVGRIWKTNNEGGVLRLHLHNLAGDETCKIQSATIDLSNVQYDDLPALIDLPESEITVTQRDLEGHIKSVTPPSLFQADVTKDLPLQMCVSKDFPDICKGVSLSWSISQIANIKGFFEIRKRGTLDPYFEMEIKNTSDRSGVDLTKLISTDVYEYIINYYLCDPVSKELIDKDKKNILYCSKGYFACDLQNTQTSLNVVISSVENGIVTIAGKTTDVTEVEVYENNQYIQRLPLDSKYMTVDCRQLPTASYQFKPCLKDGSLGHITLPFPLYTAIKNPSRTPLSEEFNYRVEVDTDKESQQGQIKLQLDRFAKQPLLFTCTFTTKEGKQLILPQTKILFDEAKGYIINFDSNVEKINEMSLSIFIDNDNLLKLYEKAQPLVPTTTIDKKEETIKFISKQLNKKVSSHGDHEYDFCDDELDHNTHHDSFVHADLKDAHVITSEPCVSLFAQHNLVVLAPFTSLPESKDRVAIQFLDVSQDSNAVRKILNCSGQTDRSLYLDVTGMDLGNYPYEIVGDPNNGGRIFSITKNNPVFSSDPYSHSKHLLVTHEFETNRYGDVIEYKDSLKNKTDIKYNNYFRKPIQIKKPEITVMLDDNKTVVRMRPTISIGYDEKGHSNVKRYPRGNVSGSVINEAGEVLVNVLGDGTITKRAHLNNLHQEEYYRDARQQLWQRKFNLNNIVTSTIMPNGVTHDSDINEKNQCIRLTRAAGSSYSATTLMGYDPMLNMTLEWKVEEGIWRAMTYYRMGKMASQQISNSKILLWDINYFGQLKSRTYYDGEEIKFGYDFNQNIASQKSTGIRTPRKFMNYHYERTQVVIDFFGIKITEWVDKVTGKVIDVPPQNLEFVHKKGRLSRIIDWAHNKKMLYTTDSEERKICWEIRNSDDSLVTQSYSAYDEIGLETLTYDPILTVRTMPDLDGNRKISDVAVVNPITGKSSSIRLGSNYDFAGRVVLFNGIYDGFSIKLANNVGLGLQYKNDFRCLETKIVNGGLITTDLEPDSIGLLYKTTQRDGKFSTERKYNPHLKLERFVTTKDGTPTSQEMQYLGNGSGTLSVRTVKKGNDFQSQTKFSKFNEAGQAAISTVFWKAPDDYSLYDDNKFSFRWAESPVLIHVNAGRCSVDRDHHSTWSYGDSYLRQDANNNLNSVEGYEKDPSALSLPGICIFDTVPFGQVLKRMSLTLGSPFAEVTFICHNSNGQAVGTYGYGQNPDVDAPTQNTQSLLNPLLFGNGFLTPFLTGLTFDGLSGRKLTTSSGYGLNLNNGIEEAARSFPATPSIVETKEDGESAESLAESEGNRSNAELIAVANGTSPTQTFKQGHTLIAPQVMRESNRVGEFGNYAELREKLMVNLMPHIKQHLEEADSGGLMSFIGEVAKIIVIGIANLYAPMIAPYAMAYCFGGAFAASALSQAIALNITRAVTAAFLDAAGQAALVGLHMQPKISGEEILNMGLGQIITPGVDTFIGNRMIAAGVSNSIAQLVRMGVTSNHRFDFRSVLSSMASAQIGESIGSRMYRTSEEVAVGTVLETATTALVTGAIYQRSPLIQDVLAQSIGAVALRGTVEMMNAAQRQAQGYQSQARVEEAAIHREPEQSRPYSSPPPKPLRARDQQFADSVRIPEIPDAKANLAGQVGQNGYGKSRSEGLRNNLSQDQAQSVNQASMEAKHPENVTSGERWKETSVGAQSPTLFAIRSSAVKPLISAFDKWQNFKNDADMVYGIAQTAVIEPTIDLIKMTSLSIKESTIAELKLAANLTSAYLQPGGISGAMVNGIKNKFNQINEDLASPNGNTKGRAVGEIINTATSLLAGGGLSMAKLSELGMFALKVTTSGSSRLVRQAGGIGVDLKSMGVEKSLPNFVTRDLLEAHFNKHGNEFKDAFKTPDEYLSGAHYVIKNGIKVSYEYKGENRIGYVKFMGNAIKGGAAKFEFVGTKSENITTYHIESGKDFWKMLNKDPYLKNITPYGYIEPKLDFTRNFTP